MASNTMSGAPEEELSLQDLVAPLEDVAAAAASATANSTEDTDPAVIQLLSECFGVNGVSGTCIRHVTYPVITGMVLSNDSDATCTPCTNNTSSSTTSRLKIVSCRVCYVEEKSVGIRQYPTFAAVVTQLKACAGEASHTEFNSSMALFGSMSSFDLGTLASPEHNSSQTLEPVSEDTVTAPSTATAATSTTAATIPHENLSMRFLAMLQQPGAMESCLKRLNQVQNWMLRAKEKDLLVQQLQLRKLEKRLSEALQTNEELKGTVKQLRRTIQQDLKVIKTMATQQMEDELAAESSHHHTYEEEEVGGGGGSSSPSKGVSNSPAMVKRGVSPTKSSNSRFSPTKRAGVQRNMSSVSISIPEHEEQQADDIDVETDEATDEAPPTATPDRDFGRTRSSRSLYWNNEALKSTKIFQSFRGGLLDIPKSPPAARHDRDHDGNVNPHRKKLQLNTAAMDALKLPSRALSRANSSTATPPPPKSMLLHSAGNSATNPPATIGQGISLDAIASKLALFADDDTAPAKAAHMPMMPPFGGLPADSVDGTDDMGASTIVSTTDDSVSTLTMGTNDLVANVAARHVNSTEPNVPMSKSVVDAATDEVKNDDPDAPEAATVAGTKEFFVTGATCHDKFGDEGIYTGYILVTEGLPHGAGKMEYESGRVYDGDWVSGQWHGKGKLLNPNGDSYDGEFFFDARHGQGIYRWDNGDVYVGNFSSDKRHGKGKFSFHNGNVYQGEFCDGMFEGFGRYDFEGGYYEGDWKEGRYDGSGELMYATGGKYTGEFRNSVAHGFGMEVLPDGTKRRGIWVDGKPTE